MCWFLWQASCGIRKKMNKISVTSSELREASQVINRTCLFNKYGLNTWIWQAHPRISLTHGYHENSIPHLSKRVLITAASSVYSVEVNVTMNNACLYLFTNLFFYLLFTYDANYWTYINKQDQGSHCSHEGC
jgi:hypothetical protein